MSVTISTPDAYRLDAHNGAGKLVARAVYDAYGWALMIVAPRVSSTGGSCQRKCCAATAEARVKGSATRTVLRVDEPLRGKTLRESAHAALVGLTAGVS